MSEDIKKTINELHIYEKKLLKELEANSEVTPIQIAENTGMDIKSVMSAAGSLASKDIIEVDKEVQKTYSLTDDGLEYAEKGLPERRILRVLADKKEISMMFFYQKPYIWQRPLFWVILIAVLVGTGIGYFLWREHKIKMENLRLEALVEERTADLKHEKDKSDMLLRSILPDKVADKLKEIIEMQLEASLTELQFECSYTLTDPNESRLLTKAQDFEVYSVPLSHRIPTTGFFFKSTMRNKPFRYAFISDTIYKPDIIPVIKDATLIYHEATFTEEFRKQAIEKFHSTAKDAANIAKMTNAERLLIGHFSKRFNDPSVLVNEAKEVFENTIAIEDEMEIAL